MTQIRIENATKMYGDFAAVRDVSVDIPDGSFVCLLGPSGCGKTTLLRLVAGLEDLSEGALIVGGEDYGDIPAHKREFGMVFQSLALFPHLTVAENIAYPLKVRGAPAAERRARARELLDLVKLPGVEDRYIHQLSGGQRQRVAIARGLAIDPKVFLLDEPLSALDANLREHMQIELRQLQKDLGVTTIVVTHDQREAMSMADIVILMKEGEVQQVGTPMEIYRNPANPFVANFIGVSNLIAGRLVDDRTFDAEGTEIRLAPEDILHVAAPARATLSLRPEDVVVHADAERGQFRGKVVFLRDLGASVEILLRVGEMEITSVCAPQSRPDVSVGDDVGVEFLTGRATVLAL
ncbi:MULTISPECIES: ABC transporter ATP-binding protein [unclassified Sulfitobacter]|uniref:ABC transporter ATP-binding protein n=1 Tax=unclassified Sulfitobacter TaxID=196795 RepID=UPI0007C2B92C|nr:MULTISPECIES: ABC transporter ATP-binding protein [unclassified Sulfitobacter]KZX94165.1 ABC transporter ATP-binding protein [Sulfitobacter sp. HI0023]KZY26146.1 ABC transporter ATP-binding protein [Sulfitobacter sp. HI0040]KZZ65989.1 ABC transporter ATP-binding protein [Sulfitobacter sp. HI0129]